MGLNMIRPEGKLEHDEFYDLADRYGILVLPGWECCNKWEGYAGAESGQGWAGDDFRIAAESMTAVAERIRNHPSVAAFLIGSDFAPDARIEKGYLDALTAAEWPNPIVSSASRRSSPQLGSSGMKMDGPYDWVPPNYWYDNRLGAAYGFGSELSAGPGVPELDSLRAMMTPAELDVLWRQPTAKHFHAARPGSQFEQLALYNAGLSNRYGAPTSLQDYVRKAQLANYESTRAQFEAYGERQDATDASHTTGVVYWMLNNAWPSLTWHLYDHSLATDAGYFGAKKANGQTHVQYAYDDRSVVVVNNSAAARSGLTVTASVFNLDGTQKFTQTVNGVSVPALGTTRPLTIPQLTGLSGAYFVKLTTSAGGVETDRNVYWLSTKAETLNWGGSTWYHTPVSSYGNLTSLTSLARTTVSSTVATSQSGDTTTTKVTLRNTGTGPVPAFFVTATLRGAAGKRVQPVAWTDNYVTLWPGESTTLTGTYRTSDLGTATPTVEVTGINL
jgi:exo-1,4-beta-D-glucosaminidase